MISEKIVVIDDDERVITSLKASLWEYEIIPFTEPTKALRYLASPNDARLVILDVHMRNINGLEVLEKINKLHQDIAVIMLTGYATQDIIIESLRLRAVDFLEKPFDVTQLKSAVRRVLKQTLIDAPKENASPTRTERIRRFIDRNYKNVALEHVAEAMCLSPKYVGQILAQKKGECFREYKLGVRLEKAKEMLLKTSLNINEIAVELGYENPESFMRTFKARCGLTPTEYRNSKHKEGKVG